MQPPHVEQWQQYPGGPPDADGWRSCPVADFRQAEELLDRLERVGAEREFLFADGRPVVRWRPAGFKAQTAPAPPPP